MSIMDKCKFVLRDDFPKWVSDGALVVAENFSREWGVGPDGVAHYDMSHQSRVERQKSLSNYQRYFDLFTSLDMKYAWEKVSTFDATNFHGQIWFAYVLWLSIPDDLARCVTLGDATKWKTDTLESLTELSLALDKMPNNFSDLEFDYLYSNHLELAYGDDSSLTIPHINDVLDALRAAVDDSDYSPGFYRSNIGAKGSNRTFFIRALTCAFKQQTEKSYGKIVTIATSTAYSSNITDSEVSRAAKDHKWEECWPFVPPAYEAHIESGTMDELRYFFEAELDTFP